MIDPERLAQLLAARTDLRPEALIVLGSGLGVVEREVTEAVAVPFSDIPGMPTTSVSGHAGRFVIGRVGGLPVIVQSGRFHAYEGHSHDVLALPVRAASALGATMLIATNAAGGVRPDLRPGDLVLIDDHLNLMFRNPLVGPVWPGETRFPDMSEPYDRRLREWAVEVARAHGWPLTRGVYGAVLGPSFETAAEVRALGRLGVDVVGMSTVPEVIVAAARGMRCLAFSMVTNQATGLSAGPVDHAEVLAVGDRAGSRLGALLVEVLKRLSDAGQSGDTK